MKSLKKFFISIFILIFSSVCLLNTIASDDVVEPLCGPGFLFEPGSNFSKMAGLTPLEGCNFVNDAWRFYVSPCTETSQTTDLFSRLTLYGVTKDKIEEVDQETFLTCVIGYLF